MWKLKSWKYFTSIRSFANLLDQYSKPYKFNHDNTNHNKTQQSADSPNSINKAPILFLWNTRASLFFFSNNPKSRNPNEDASPARRNGRGVAGGGPAETGGVGGGSIGDGLGRHCRWFFFEKDTFDWFRLIFI